MVEDSGVFNRRIVDVLQRSRHSGTIGVFAVSTIQSLIFGPKSETPWGEAEIGKKIHVPA